MLAIRSLAFLIVVAGGVADYLCAEAPCAPSPEAAVLQGLGLGQAAAGNKGYRVRDVVVDPLLQRTFVRVEACGSSRSNPVLLPFAAVHAPLRVFDAATSQQQSMPNLAERPSIAAGTAVELAMRSSRVDLLLHGKTLAKAEMGSQVEVEVSTLQAGEPGGRFRGRLVSAGRVEVEP